MRPQTMSLAAAKKGAAVRDGTVVIARHRNRTHTAGAPAILRLPPPSAGGKGGGARPVAGRSACGALQLIDQIGALPRKPAVRLRCAAEMAVSAGACIDRPV